MTLFKELYLDLLQKIDSGTYKKGGALPSEGELQELYQVSRTTVRKAVEMLVADQKVVKQKGVGLFVAPDISKQNIIDMTGIIKQTEINKDYKISLKDSYLRKANPYYATVLDIDPDELLYFISFVNTSSKSRLLEKLWLPLDYFPAFDPNMLKRVSVLEVINSGDRKIQNLYQDFQLITASEDETKLLDVSLGSPLFKITNTFIDDKEQVIALETKVQDALQVKYTIDFN